MRTRSGTSFSVANEQQTRDAAARLGSDADHCELVRLLEADAGVELS